MRTGILHVVLPTALTDFVNGLLSCLHSRCRACYFVPRRMDGDRREIGGATAVGYIRARSLTEGGYVAWVLRLVEIGAEGEGSCADVVEISRPDGLGECSEIGGVRRGRYDRPALQTANDPHPPAAIAA